MDNALQDRLQQWVAVFGKAIFGAGLILTAAIVSAVVLRVTVGGPVAAVATFPLAVLSGLSGLISEQYDASLVTSGVAALCFALLGVLLVQAVAKTVAAGRDSGGARVV